jgi:hypothetical protein
VEVGFAVGVKTLRRPGEGPQEGRLRITGGVGGAYCIMQDRRTNIVGLGV